MVFSLYFWKRIGQQTLDLPSNSAASVPPSNSSFLWSSWFSNDRENAFVDGDWFCLGIGKEIVWGGLGPNWGKLCCEEVFRK